MAGQVRASEEKILLARLPSLLAPGNRLIVSFEPCTKKESDLAKARAALDSEATERERLQVKLSKLKIDFDELEARDTKKESNLAKARAALDSEATERERLQVKLSKLKIDFDELEARKSHHIQILKDELEFEKKLHSADLRMVQSQHESRMVELEAGQKVKDLEEALSTERERTQNKEERSFYSFRTYHNVSSHCN
ncbi:uncharacterized protein ACBT44_001518 [Syngnathus typhle]